MNIRSQIFGTKIQNEIEGGVISLINGKENFMSASTINSPRAIGDAIQKLLEVEFKVLVPKSILKKYDSSFARRSMADFAFTDVDGFYYVVDNKTHNLNTAFNMPNLTSVERLTRFYEDDQNYFSLLIISYKIKGEQVGVKDCHFIPIEHLDWNCLTIGALGWGQIQIANSNNITINQNNTRKQWMLQLCDRLSEFYPKEIEKVTDRIKHFENIRKYWEVHEDI